MGWKEYQEQITEPHDFGEFGCPDFKVDLRRVDSFPYGEMKAYTAQASELKKIAKRAASEDDGITDEEAFASAAAINDQVLVKCVARWNIPHPDTGEILPLPSEDISSLDVLPSEFVARLHIWLQEDSQLAQMAATGNETSGEGGESSPPRRGRRKPKVASRKTKA